MREIKFRVWYTAQNRMVTDCRLGEMDEEYEDYAIFMQYTGLKDQNDAGSTCVYEADMLTDETGKIYKVEWDYRDTGWVGIDTTNNKKHNLVELLLDYAIVIGNKYENKELL